MAKKTGNKDIFEGNVFSKTTDDVNVLIKAVQNLDAALIQVAKDQKKILNQQDNKTVESINKTNKAVETLNNAQKQAQKLRVEEIKLQQAREKAFDRFEKQEQKNIKTAQRSRKVTVDQSNAFKILTKQVNSAQARFKRLAAQYGETDKRTKQALKTFNRLDDSLRKINNAAKDGRRDVGRYGTVWEKTGVTMKRVAGIALTGLGIRALGRAIKSTFQRIRDFDKEMNNLAGIAGTTRDELGGLERRIIDVAGSSIKTSNEVAKLATVLIALGKTPKEVEKLLKPANDLSIALNATSEEAGELLVSTLNAFGKGAEEGERFADVIAKIRTSTSLNFERIKDSLGFVSATASVLNLTIGETGALIGVLQDNGVKAARAGRLLNSSFIKLAKEGKTLEGSLDRINKAQERGASSMELLQIAERDFGLQSASLGVILANNRDKVAELANEFDNLSEGSLKKLTDEQLKSMDAQFKILDSTWEKFILSIENGDGVISATIRNAIKLLNGLIETLTKLNRDSGDFLIEGVEKRQKLFLKRFTDNAKRNKKTLDDFIKKQNDNLEITEEERAKRIASAVLQVEEFNAVDRLASREKLLKRQAELEKIFGDDEVRNKKILEKRISQSSTLERLGTSDRIIRAREEERAQLSELIAIRSALAEEQSIFDAKQRESIETNKAQAASIEKVTKASKKASDEKNKSLEDEIQLFRDLGIEIDAVSKLEELRLSRFIDFDKQEEQQDLEFTLPEIQKRNAIALRQIEIDAIEAGKTSKQIQKEIFEEQVRQLEEVIELKKALNNDATNEELKLLKLKGDKEKELAENQLKDITDLTESALSVISELASDAFKEELAAIDKLINASENRISELRDKAKESQLSAEESIALEQQKEAELERKRQLEQKRQERIQAFFTVLSTFNANVAANEPNPLAKTAFDVGVLKGLVGTLSAFDGVEDTGSRGDVDSKGGKWWVLHPRERVVPKVDNDKLKGISNAELGDIGSLYKSGAFTDTGDMFNRQSLQLNGMLDTGTLENKIDELKSAIKANAPIEASMKIDETRKLLMYTRKKGNKITRERSKLHS